MIPFAGSTPVACEEPDNSKVTRLTKSSTPTRTHTPTEGTNDRRQEILNLAAELFAQRGYEAVGVRQIADAAGILAGSLYHHFPSKRDLYIEVHKAALADAAAAIDSSARRPMGKAYGRLSHPPRPAGRSAICDAASDEQPLDNE